MTMNERRARRIVADRSNGVCERCSRARATDMHHRKNRSQSGAWSPSNLLHLCHRCHMEVTVNPRIAYEQGWSVPSYADPTTTPAWVAGWGFVLLTDSGEFQDVEAA